MSNPEGVSKKDVKDAPERDWGAAVREIFEGSWAVGVGAFVAALFFGGILIAAADPEVQSSLSYIFSRPSDFFVAIKESVIDTYIAMFQGSVIDFSAWNVKDAVEPFTKTLTMATPLIFAALGIGVAFRAGLFNIGAQGQIILGATAAGYIGFTFHMPIYLHTAFAMLGAILGGAIWAGIAGALKAYTGAHEVIVTIMLNSIALYLLAWFLTKPAFIGESTVPQSMKIDESAEYGAIFDNLYTLHWGFIFAILSAVFVWWLMDRSTVGFKLRAVGANANASKTAGIKVNWNYVLVMIVAGSLAGLAGSAQVLGTQKYLTGDIAASIGFDAITVALLGRSKPAGIVAAGILFGALRRGGYAVQGTVPIEIVAVVQSLIVLFIAAPPLVRTMFHLPAPGSTLKRLNKAAEGASA